MYKIVPVFEAGDVSSVKGPTSLLSNISKVLECLKVCNKITEHICQIIIIA